MSDEQVKDIEQEDVIEAEVVEEATEDAPEPELTLEDKLAAAEAKSAENLEGWQRALAELANARKRFDKQRLDARSNATVDVVSELLPILDDLSLAMANVPANIADDDWFGGFNLIPKKILTVLERLKIEKIESVGADFDPIFHNAIMQEETDEHESGTVVKEFQTGFKLGDRVIRPAVVAVAA